MNNLKEGRSNQQYSIVEPSDETAERIKLTEQTLAQLEAALQKVNVENLRGAAIIEAWANDNVMSPKIAYVRLHWDNGERYVIVSRFVRPADGDTNVLSVYLGFDRTPTHISLQDSNWESTLIQTISTGITDDRVARKYTPTV